MPKPAIGASGWGATLNAYLSNQERGLNVKEYGAVGDGATNDVPAFVAAIVEANASSAGMTAIIVPPGTYNLTAGISQVITGNNVHVVGAGTGATTIKGGTGTLFTWGNGGTAVVGGGMHDLSITYTTPDSASKVIYINSGSSQKFSNLFLDNVRQLARLGESGALAAAPSFSHIYGSTDPAAGSVVLDAAFGSALAMNDVILNAKGVGFPTDTTSAHPANDTTFLRFGQGSWDTAHCYGVISNRYNRGLDINLTTAVAVTNMWFYGCVWDYSKTSGIRLLTNHSGANLRSLYLMGGWAVATDAYSIEVTGTLGAMKNVHFSDVVGRQGGKCNWRLTGGVMEKVMLTSCHGLGANRLAASNTGSDQDDLVVLGSGVSVQGGTFGEDGSSYTGFANQARYGVTTAADIACRVVDVEGTGVTGGFQITANTTSDRRRLVTRNRRGTDALPEYATTASVTAPGSTSTQTHVAGTLDTLYIYGGTVTSITHNSTEVATSGPVTLNLRPGDTWSITYSAAPTIKRVVAP